VLPWGHVAWESLSIFLSVLVHRLPASGRYTVRVSDPQYMASPEHFFRVSVGELPVVTGIFPLAVPADRESEIQLAGENLPVGASAKVKASAMGEVTVPVDAERFRARREFKVLVGATPETNEVEPNDAPANATSIQVPGAVNGRLSSVADVDLFRFGAKRGQRWVIETMAARRGSPADTKIEMEFVYDNSAGNPRNPNSPAKRVLAGPGIADEMAGVHIQSIPVHMEELPELGRALWGAVMRSVGGSFYTLPQ